MDIRNQQSTMDKWIINKEAINPAKRFFYLEWNRKKPKKIEWLDNLPDGAVEFRVVKIKSIGLVSMCGKISSEKNILRIPSNIKEGNTQLLKSNLQKCVRCGYRDLALQTTIHLLAMDQNDLLRRLPIIMVEDVSSHRSFTVLVWMMAAFGEWKPNLIHIQWILGVVSMITKFNIFDEPPAYIEDSNMNIHIIDGYLKKSNLKSTDMAFIYSFAIRASYGGMSGDMNMLVSLMWKW